MFENHLSSRVRLFTALAVLVVLVATAVSVASSANPVRPPGGPHSGAPIHLKFRVHLTDSTPAQVAFSDGVDGIGTQVAASQTNGVGIRTFIAQQRGFAMGADAAMVASVDADVAPTKGAKAIQGNVILPAGATLTLQVDDGAATPITGPFSIPLSVGPLHGNPHPRHP
jgi:hypothetical protein